MTNKNDQLVVGIFPTEKAAKDAAKAIKEWDSFDAPKDVKLGAMAALTFDANKGKLHADEIGQRSTRSGLGWGTAIGAVAGILTGGLALIPGLIIGGAAGSALGALNHKSVGMTDAQHEEIVSALKSGGAALAIMCDDFEVAPTVAKLKEEGADVSHYEVPEETAEAVTMAAAAQAAASEAVDTAADAVDDTVDAAKAVVAEVPGVGEDHVEHVSKLMAVTGLSAAEAAKLHDSGVEKASQFMSLAATKEGRAALAEETGVDEDVILNGAKKLDLMRVKGVGEKYASLLLASGVDTVPELATRNAGNLVKKMAQVNLTEKIVSDVPSEEVVSDWVAQAKELPRMLYY